MKPPRIPPLIIDIVQSGLLACEGIIFETRDSCPVCGGKLSGYDTKKKQFAVMLEGNARHPVHVLVKRFSCRECDTICFADEPFYPVRGSDLPSSISAELLEQQCHSTVQLQICCIWE